MGKIVKSGGENISNRQIFRYFVACSLIVGLFYSVLNIIKFMLDFFTDKPETILYITFGIIMIYCAIYDVKKHKLDNRAK